MKHVKNRLARLAIADAPEKRHIDTDGMKRLKRAMDEQMYCDIRNWLVSVGRWRFDFERDMFPLQEVRHSLFFGQRPYVRVLEDVRYMPRKLYYLLHKRYEQINGCYEKPERLTEGVPQVQDKARKIYQ